tara:strand:+ start:1186 stop:1563 length:378 start_codon:yes stop_codon:yes gene_type:complete
MIAKLRDRLLESSSIDTVEPYLREETSLPVVVYEFSADDREMDLNQNSTLRRTVVLLRCMASSYSSADDMASAVESTLEDWSEDSPPINCALAQSVTRSFAVPVEASNALIYEAAVEVVVWWSDE